MTIYSPHHIDQETKPLSVAVIGAGIIGICTALSLRREGFRVTLIDGNGLSQGCSKGNAGHFATEQVFPLADKRLIPQLPKMLIDPSGPFRIKPSYLIKAIPWFLRFALNMRDSRVKAHTRALKSLNELSLDAFGPLIDDANLNELFTKRGSLLTFERYDDKEIRRQFNAFLQQGVSVELLDKHALRELEPNLSENIKAALLFSDVGHSCDPERLGVELAKDFLKRGGQFLQQEVASILPRKFGVEVKHKFASGRFNRVVLATGAWSKSLLAPLGYKVPLDAERGYHLMIDQKNLLSRPVASADRKFIMTPMSAGLRLAGTVEFAGLDTKMNEKRANALLPHAQKLLPGLVATRPQAKDKWMGCRPSLPDSLPVIGQAPNHQHLYLAFGHQHLGLTQAAITGKLITQLLTGQATSVDIEPFCLSRFN